VTKIRVIKDDKPGLRRNILIKYLRWLYHKRKISCKALKKGVLYETGKHNGKTKLAV